MASSNFPISWVSSLWTGFRLPFTAMRLILTTPRLLSWSIVPVGITLLLYSLLFPSLNNAAHSTVLQLLSMLGVGSLGWFGDLLMTLFSWLTTILVFVFAALTFSNMAAILSSPFNDFLAEAAEPYSRPPLSKCPNPSWKRRFALIGTDVFKTAAAGLASIVVLLFSWIPILNVVAILISFWLVTFQFISYPQTRRSQGLYYGIRFIRTHLFLCTGFGATMALFFSIPVISGFFLPVAVVGGTLLVGHASALVRQKLPPQGRQKLPLR